MDLKLMKKTYHEILCPYINMLSIIVSFSTSKFETSSQVYVIMDKTWISKPRNTVDYLIGLSHFLDFAFENGAVGDTI
ncbi:hypothetical protein Lal_00024960 [Lupinus albus]|nr:hypothetical protein Lal_00024960 [Lupinus albus]